MALYPPIIDNTIGAFELKKASQDGIIYMPIRFYYQDNEGYLEKDEEGQEIENYVLVQVLYEGVSALTSEAIFLSVNPITEPTSFLKNKANQSYFACSVSENSFKNLSINKGYSINIASVAPNKFTIGTNSEGKQTVSWEGQTTSPITIEEFLLTEEYKTYCSEWSSTVVKYALPPMTFEMYGSLSKAEMQKDTDIEEEKKLKSNKSFSFPWEAYRVKGALSYDYNEIDDYREKNELETDRIIWYQVQVLDVSYSDGTAAYSKIDATNTREYIDLKYDSTGRSFVYEFKNDFVTWYLDKLSTGGNIEVLGIYTTLKGYTGSFSYLLSVGSDDGEIVINYDRNLQLKDFDTTSYPSHGGIFITCRQETVNGSTSPMGTFSVERAIDKDGAGGAALSYGVIYQETGVMTNEVQFGYLDQSAESGIPYRYRITFSYEQEQSDGSKKTFWAVNSSETNPTIENIYCTDDSKISLLFIDDMFLTSKNMTLRIKFDPTLTGYKRNYQDIITPTLGGAYPFVRRNGEQKYKTFTIGGLISYQGDSSKITLEGNYGENKYVTWLEEPSLFYNKNKASQYSIEIEDTVYQQMSYYNRERVKEKLFREQVLEFLYSNNMLLFKSFQEGNAFIRLSNIQLTSKKELDRNIYSFTATATEVQETTEANYMDFFSDKIEDIDYILARAFVKVTDYINNSAVVIASNDLIDLNDEVSDYEVEIVESVIYYAIAPNAVLDNEQDWSSDINESQTYYTKAGQAVYPEKYTVGSNETRLRFKPSRMPATKVVVNSRKIIKYQGAAINLYYQPYGLSL